MSCAIIEPINTRKLIVLTSPVDRKSGGQSSLPPTPTKLHMRNKTWEDASHAIEAALDRLHFIAVAIRKASAKQLGHSVTSFVTNEDVVFRRDIASWVRYRFPAARKGLCQQLGDSIAIRRRILLQTERHAKKLAVRRIPTKMPSAKKHDSKVPNPQTGVKRKADNHLRVARHHPSILASGVTKASRPDPHSPALQNLHRPKQRALTTVISTISTTQEDKFEYPPMPKMGMGETRIQCPFCFRPLERKELDTKDSYWKHHIDEHLKPYGCLFPECAESQLFFVRRNQWKSHMDSAHSKDWLRKVHTIVWYCDMDHNEPETFETEQQWREHMNNLDSHPKRKLKRAPTQAQLDALSPRKQQVALREKFVCPLCEQVPEKIRPLVEKGQGDQLQMYNIVVDHVADHLKSLSLMAVPSSDAIVPETPGAFGRSAFLMSESFKRPMGVNSVPQPPSGQEFLDGVSLPPETWSELDRDGIALAKFLDQNPTWDQEYLDYIRPEEPPEPSDQDWVEFWRSWRSENDPFPVQDSQSDPVLVQLVKAKIARAGRTQLPMRVPTPEQVDIDEKDGTGRTALSFAAEIGDNEAVDMLLKKGANVSTADQDGQTPLLWATKNGHAETAQILLNAGSVPDAADQKYGRTPLSWAAAGGHEAVIRVLIQHGAAIDAADNSLRTPLSWAASRGQEGTVLMLMERGADIESSDPKYGRTPLSWAAVRGHEGTVALLLDRGVKVDTTDREHGRTPLSWAAENGHEGIVRKLLDAGADIEATDRDSLQTPLMFAAEAGHEETVRLLLNRGADTEKRDQEGFTALEWANEGEHEHVAKLLRNPDSGMSSWEVVGTSEG